MSDELTTPGSALRALAERQPPANLQHFRFDQPVEPNPLLPLLIGGLAPRVDPSAWLAVLERFYPPEHEVTLVGSGPDDGTDGLARLGRLAEALETRSALALYLPPLAPEQAGASPFGLRALVHRLRAPGGCPWDAKQTPRSLLKFVVEEAFEVVDAVEDDDPVEICDELGDLLLQVVLQAELAEEAGRFDLTDVTRAISDKLIRRHPHVFAATTVSGAEEVEANWEQLKRREKGAEPGSALHGVPRGLPGLVRSQEIQRALKRAGFDWPDRTGVLAKLDEELAEMRAVLEDPPRLEAELGDVLFMLARLATDAGFEAEAALRGTIARVESRFRYVEQAAKAAGREVRDLELAEIVELWRAAKRREVADDESGRT